MIEDVRLHHKYVSVTISHIFFTQHHLSYVYLYIHLYILYSVIYRFITMVDHNMQEQRDAFQQALVRFGFPPQAIQAILANGLTTTSNLLGIESTDIENIVNVEIYLL